ncbi:MAG: family 16 glycosylhydrolase [Bacteroidales bacterium]
MANIAFGNKYFIFSKFSSIPKTSKIEADRANLKKELEEFNEFNDSDELKSFNELSKYLESNEHKSLVSTLQKDKSVEEGRIKLYETQKKSRQFKSFFKFKNSSKLKEYSAIAASDELAKYNKLKEITSSANFASEKNKIEAELKKIKEKEKQKESKDAKAENFASQKKELENKLEGLILQESEYHKLSKSRNIKFHYKFGKSQRYIDFLAFQKSKELKDYLALEEYLSSAEHKELMASLIEREADENKKIKEHTDFKNSKKYKWYLDLKGSTKFDDLKKWKVVFEDDFSGKQLDQEKWLPRYYWGDKLIKDASALEHDKAFPTNGKNIETGGTLKIITKREKTEGKVWKQPFGFLPKEFEFTTGLVNTGKSHRQKFGKIEAKIKINFAQPVNYNFWMVSENNLPHIDILKLQKKKSKVDMGHVYNASSSKQGPERKMAEYSGLDVSQDFFIYTLEWSKNKLTWKINDVVVNEQTQHIPNEEMYLVFSSSMTDKANGTGLPASMEVDWVRCYQTA